MIITGTDIIIGKTEFMVFVVGAVLVAMALGMAIERYASKWDREDWEK